MRADIDKILKVAAETCKKIDRSKKHVSIIVCKGKIVSVGTNRFKTHPLARKYGYLFEEMHSELDALIKCEQREDLHLFNCRFNSHGEMRISRPCDKCLPWCLTVFDTIHYTTNEGFVKMNFHNSGFYQPIKIFK